MPEAKYNRVKITAVEAIHNFTSLNNVVTGKSRK